MMIETVSSGTVIVNRARKSRNDVEYAGNVSELGEKGNRTV